MKAERPNIRVVSRNEFTVIQSMDELTEVLFGPMATGATVAA